MRRKLFVLISIVFLFVVFWILASPPGHSRAVLATEQYAWQKVEGIPIVNFYDLDMISANDGWALGGTSFWHWNGTDWAQGSSTATGIYNGLGMVSAADGWAVGRDGKIARWDGASWKDFDTLPDEEWLWDVDMLSANDGWMAGDGGTILHWDGTDWSFVPSPVDSRLYRIRMVSANEGWIAGFDFDTSIGVILHWDGTEWIKQTIPQMGRLFDIAMSSPSEAWAVGENGVVLHWEDEVWDEWRNPTSRNSQQNLWLMGIDMLSPTSGWFVGGNTDFSFIAKWDGTSWISVESPFNSFLQAVDMISETDGWAVGYQGTILHYTLVESAPATPTHTVTPTPTATPTETPTPTSTSTPMPDEWFAYLPALLNPAKEPAWQEFDSPTTYDLQDIDMLSDKDGWAVGGVSTFLHWDGSQWAPGTANLTGSMSGVSMVSATDGWAVGAGGKIARWNGTSWELYGITPDEEWLFDVDMVTADDGWAVGNDGQYGRVLHWDGSSWLFISVSTQAQLYKVHMVSEDEGWIAGFDNNDGRGVILRWDGRSWKEQSIPQAPRLFDVAMPSASEAWAVGENGALLQWANGAWSNWSQNSQNSGAAIVFLMGIDMLSTDLGWMVGGYIDSAYIGRWDGSTWTQESSPIDEYLQAVDMISATDGWAVGYGGTILHYAPRP